MTEEFLWELDQDDNFNYSSSDDDAQPALKLSSFTKKMPIQRLSEILVITSTINDEPSVPLLKLPVQFLHLVPQSLCMLMQIIRSAAETPHEWWDVIRALRKKPSPFIVHVLEQKDFFCFSEYFNKRYKKSCSFPIRPVRELWFDVNNPKRIQKRTSWHGLWEQVMLLNKKNYLLSLRIPILHTAPLPISKKKLNDLQVLKKFCSPPAAQFFDSLPAEIKEAEVE